MKDADVALVVESARERHPGVRPRIISDNGPQFNAKDFKSYIRLTGMTHVRTSPDYPQSNRKIERWHRTLPEPTEHRIRHEKRWLDPRIQRPYPSAQESGSR
jgi:transposase InsO family protein